MSVFSLWIAFQSVGVNIMLVARVSGRLTENKPAAPLEMFHSFKTQRSSLFCLIFTSRSPLIPRSPVSNMSAANDPPPPYLVQDPMPAAALSPPQRVQSTFYHIYHTFSGDYNVLLDNKNTSFFINSRIWRTPDLVVHRGDGGYDREIANVQFPEFGNHYEMNIFREVNVKWSAMQTKMTLDGHFTATVPVPNATGASVNTARPFAWKKTPIAKELVDGETNQTIAVMHGTALGTKKCFVLELQAQFGMAFEILVLTSAMVLYESQKREFSKRSGSHNGSRRRAQGIAGSMMTMMGGASAGGAGDF